MFTLRFKVWGVVLKIFNVFYQNKPHVQGSCIKTHFLSRPAGPRSPDTSAALFPLPCQKALFGADEQPVALFLGSSWLGYAAPKSVSDSTWCPL